MNCIQEYNPGKLQVSAIGIQTVKTERWSFGIAATPCGVCFSKLPSSGDTLEGWLDRNVAVDKLLSFPIVTTNSEQTASPAAAEHNENVARILGLAAHWLEAYAKSKEAQQPPMVLVGTPFQRKVWRAVLQIPPGETRSYAEVAAAAGSPRAYQAAGQAVGANPLPMFIPCHRVVGSSGKLVGFGGGLELKRDLLSFEGAHWEGG